MSGSLPPSWNDVAIRIGQVDFIEFYMLEQAIDRIVPTIEIYLKMASNAPNSNFLNCLL